MNRTPPTKVSAHLFFGLQNRESLLLSHNFGGTWESTIMICRYHVPVPCVPPLGEKQKKHFFQKAKFGKIAKANFFENFLMDFGYPNLECMCIWRRSTSLSTDRKSRICRLPRR